LSLTILLGKAESQAKDNLSWKSLLPGLQQASWSTKDSQGNSLTLELYKIDPRQFRLQVVQAKDLGQEKVTAKEIVSKTGGLVAVNAGFFDPVFKSMGLIVKDGNILNPVRPVSWWGVFSFDKNAGANVTRAEEFQVKPSVEMAIQAGPRLLDDGKPLPLKKNDSQKTFLGITPEGEIIVGTTDLCAVDATDLANILQKELQLKDALNLDGGSSTQLYAKVGSYEKEIPGVTAVANGIVLLPRK
jgi:uncharacterized protein YigE (DUF2233 family)